MIEAEAKFCDHGCHRYWLVRRWDLSRPQLTYFLLNPSRAGAAEDDVTVKKLRRITEADRGGGFELVNLFATVDTKQVGLHLPQSVGADNDGWVRDALERATKLVHGWGDAKNGENRRLRQEAIDRQARGYWRLVEPHDQWCFRSITSGAPGHPCRLANDQPIVPFEAGGYPF